MTQISHSSDHYSQYDREFFREIKEAAIFSAFVCAIKFRKTTEELTQKDLCQRTGKDKGAVSKMLSGPGNWQIKTMTELAFALDLDFDFVLVDKKNPCRRFTPSGISTKPARTGACPKVINALASEPQSAQITYSIQTKIQSFRHLKSFSQNKRIENGIYEGQP